MNVRRAVIGLGSNLGERIDWIDRAVSEIAGACEILARAPIYETDPIGPAQPDYLNTAILVRTRAEAPMLLVELLAIETRLGRVRNERWGARTIDLDLLWMEGVALHEPGIEVPHPRLRERAFALVPLANVAPDARDPRTGEIYASLALAATSLRKVRN